jgi:hypothetical protein
MAKNRTLNEIRQSKEYQQAVKSRAVDTQCAADEIVDTLTTSKLNIFDIIFESVNDEMHKYTVFQEQTYLTDEGMDMFEDQWFEFYHEHHGEIMSKIMKTLTN